MARPTEPLSAEPIVVEPLLTAIPPLPTLTPPPVRVYPVRLKARPVAARVPDTVTVNGPPDPAKTALSFGL